MRRINGMYELPAPAFSLCTETCPNKGICISLPTVTAHEGKINTATPASSPVTYGPPVRPTRSPVGGRRSPLDVYTSFRRADGFHPHR